MPLFGLLDSATRVANAANVSKLFAGADEFQVSSADVLTLTYEIDISLGQRAVPKALHPSLPSYAQVIFRHHRDGAWGECITAELRVNARAGTNYVGYTVGAFATSPAVVSALRDRYGAPARLAKIQFERRYYGVFVAIEQSGGKILDAEVHQLLPINGKDVLFTPNLNLATVDGQCRLVHQEMEYTIKSAERGQAKLAHIDTAAWGDGDVRFTNPLPATFVTADVKYTAVKYLVDPEVPAMRGTVEV